MTANSHAMPAATWVAIDIAKRHHAVLIETPDGKHQRFRMASTHEDHQRLVDLLHGLPAPVRIALEPTGDCHRTLAYRLLQEGFEVCLVSSVAGARYREAVFNSWDKNDPKDARGAATSSMRRSSGASSFSFGRQYQPARLWRSRAQARRTRTRY